jgi:hypothetical protein
MHIFNIGLVLLFIYLNLLLLFGGWVCVCVCVPPISNDVVCYFPIQSLAFHYPMGFTLFLCVCVISPGDIYRHTHTHTGRWILSCCVKRMEMRTQISNKRGTKANKRGPQVLFRRRRRRRSLFCFVFLSLRQWEETKLNRMQGSAFQCVL